MAIISRISVAMVNRVFNTRYRLAHMTRRFPRFGRLVRKIAFDGDDMSVIPKAGTARTVDLNIEIENAGDRNVVPTDLVKNVLRRSDRIFVMDFCLCRQSNKCEDYPIDRGCIFVGKGTEKISEKYGRFVSQEEACQYIDECDRLGLVHIIGRNKLDSLWLHTGKHTDLMTICNCCPCCCLWNVTRDISKDIGSIFKRMDGVEVSVDADRCIGCGLCEGICFTKAIRITDGKCTLNQEQCRGCGRCADICPNGAVSVTYDEDKIESESDRIVSLFV